MRGAGDVGIGDNGVGIRSRVPVSFSLLVKDFVGALCLQLLRYLVINLESSEGVCRSSLYGL